MSAASGAADALTLLLEVTTVRSVDDPRAGAVTTNLSRTCDQLLATAAVRITGLPGELLLYLFGRQSAAEVEVSGPPEAARQSAQ
jgi:hypothetical protein